MFVALVTATYGCALLWSWISSFVYLFICLFLCFFVFVLFLFCLCFLCFLIFYTFHNIFEHNLHVERVIEGTKVIAVKKAIQGQRQDMETRHTQQRTQSN